MIVGTAGHIDHGKTTLVRALTGVDTDRLPQEKQRGISIELGYAFLDLPEPRAAERIGFIDVPGHERLVHTMLAGATGIDFALLLIAADDGVMPQTREHLAVLSLLGISHGAVIVTKTDRADTLRVREVMAAAALLLQGTPLAGARVLAVSAQRGDGMAELRDVLFEAARHHASHTQGRPRGFRLAVDRAFTLSGVGTVVTGTAHAGQVRVDDELQLVPASAPRKVRVRSLHAQNTVTAAARAGQRCALALAGLAKDEVERGQWVCAPGIALSTERIDVRLTLWRDEPRALRSGSTVHVHVGASDVLASVALLDADALPPGHSALAQLVLRTPVAAWRGDRVVLRDASATRTLAGGTVLDPFAPARYRRTPARLAQLSACALPSAERRLTELLAVAAMGLDISAWSRAEGCDGEPPALPPGTLRSTDAQSALSAVHAQELLQSLRARLSAFHAHYPDELGPDVARLRRLVAPRLAESLWRALVGQALRHGDIVQRGAQVHLPEHGVNLSAVDQRISQKVMPSLLSGGFDPPWVRDLAAEARESEALMRTVMARLAQRGELHQVVKDLYYPVRTVTQLAALARGIAQRHGGEVRAAEFRDATGLGRKRAIQVLEFFDRVGLLRRVQDTHRLRSDTALFDDAAS
ncbi:MAG TPA: selenocysteine-specific translation elongation factor [Rhizobacter sp.]|nr:selenocysteine-specific translation elongation factor [Rhizobacter sp.]